MPNIDRLIKAWEIFRDSNPYEICNGREFRAIMEPEYCMGQMIEDTIAILREQEAKTGHWIGTTKVFGFPRVQCSVCGSEQGAVWMYYCPICGAKMKQESRLSE
jgi:hypothetical protein